MASNNSTRARVRSRKPPSRSSENTQAPRSRPDLDAILGRFSEALALLETVQHAFVAVEEDAIGQQRLGIAAGSAEISTLERAVKETGSIYNEFDLALGAIASASR